MVLIRRMGGFIYQCPNTRLSIQAFMADDVTENAAASLSLRRMTCSSLAPARSGERVGTPVGARVHLS
jgi:hypothetical protein